MAYRIQKLREAARSFFVPSERESRYDRWKGEFF